MCVFQLQRRERLGLPPGDTDPMLDEFRCVSSFNLLLLMVGSGSFAPRGTTHPPAFHNILLTPAAAALSQSGVPSSAAGLSETHCLPTASPFLLGPTSLPPPCLRSDEEYVIVEEPEELRKAREKLAAYSARVGEEEPPGGCAMDGCHHTSWNEVARLKEQGGVRELLRVSSMQT